MEDVESRNNQRFFLAPGLEIVMLLNVILSLQAGNQLSLYLVDVSIDQRLSFLYRLDLFVISYFVALWDFHQVAVLNINNELIKNA
jgi:hypothetical protein